MITGKGVGVVLTAVVLFLLTGFTRVGWLLLVDSVLWGVLALSLLMPWFGTGRLVATRRTIGWDGEDSLPGPTEGREVRFSIAVENEGRLPAMFARVDYHLGDVSADDSLGRQFVAWLGRGHRTSSRIMVSYPKRGRVQLPSPEIRTSAPFGLFRRRRGSSETAELLVLPRRYPLDLPGRLGVRASEDLAPLMTRVGEQAAGSRTYAPGDPWQHIHWRNTARVGQVQSREFETDSGRTITSCFDASGHSRRSALDDDVLDEATRVSASISFAVSKLGAGVRVLAGQLDLATNDLGKALEALALVSGRGATTVAENLSKAGDGTVVVIVSSEGAG